MRDAATLWKYGVGVLLAPLELGLDLSYRLARRFTGKIAFRYDQMYRHLRRHSARNILEIGVYRGDRSREFVKAAAIHLPAEQVHFYGIDLFEKFTDLAPGIAAREFVESKRPLSTDEIRRALAELLPGQNIHLFAGRSDDTFVEQGFPSMDFIFIDGGHSLETIQRDFVNCARVLAPGGTIFLDDFWLSRAGGCRALLENLSAREWEKHVFPFPDYFRDTIGFIWLARVRRRG